jgi:catechol 2,3-dioxygenase-like lactoylglutathione lyase family enzyme
MIALDRLDHVVLTARDLTETCNFYQRVLGMRLEAFGNGRLALLYGDQKINLHEAGREFEPKADRPTPGGLDLCFTTRTPIEAVVAHLQASGVPILEGPVERTGARARLMSVYFRDPDGNLIEVSNELG